MANPSLTPQPQHGLTNPVTMTDWYRHRMHTPTRVGPNQGVTNGAFHIGGTAARGQVQLNADGSFSLIVE